MAFKNIITVSVSDGFNVVTKLYYGTGVFVSAPNAIINTYSQFLNQWGFDGPA